MPAEAAYFLLHGGGVWTVLCCLLMTAPVATSTHASTTQPGEPGAAACFVSVDPVIRQAVELYRSGEFLEAERVSSRSTDRKAAADLAEVIRRARWDYSLRVGEIQQKIATSIPDVTSDDVTRWIAEGKIQHRRIDGEIRIFRREPGHLFRFSEEVSRRRAPHQRPPATRPTTAPAWTLEAHLAAVVHAARERPDAVEHLPVRTRVTYAITVPGGLPGARPGSVVAAWLPFPQPYARQRDVRLLESDPPDPVVAPPAIEGAPVAGGAQRTVFLRRIIDDPAKPVKFEVKFEYVTSAYHPRLDDALALPAGDNPFTSYLQERPPHIVFAPELRAKVAEVVGDDPNPLSRARKLFYFVDEHLRWTPEEEYSTIPCLSLHGFRRGKGDCGVAAMLYISLCRIAGIPARWQSGWTTNPVGWNMHDWVEIHVEPWGWLPVDPSHGRRKSDDPAVRDFYFGHTDSYRLIVNLDYGRELHPPKATLRSEPADFQRGEVELDGKNLYFDQWDYEIRFDRDATP